MWLESKIDIPAPDTAVHNMASDLPTPTTYVAILSDDALGNVTIAQFSVWLHCLSSCKTVTLAKQLEGTSIQCTW
jgi:hypothetical protein